MIQILRRLEVSDSILLQLIYRNKNSRPREFLFLYISCKRIESLTSNFAAKVGRSFSLIIPLFLEGSAFALYEQLGESQKTSAKDIEKALLDAFAIDGFQAYEQFRDRRWNDGESVDVYLASLRQLMNLANIESEELLLRAFITGLPDEISKQLRAQVKIFGISLQDALNHARVLMT